MGDEGESTTPAPDDTSEHRRIGAALLMAAGCMVVAVGQPVLLMAVPFGILAVFLRGRSRWVSVAGAVLLGLSLAIEGSGGIGWLDRGWAILVGTTFLAMLSAFPGWGFLLWALAAVGLSAGMAGVILVLTGGWSAADGLMQERLWAGAEATMGVGRRLSSDPAVAQAFEDAARRTAELQIVAFPALLGIASVLGLGVAWWGWMRFAGAGGQIFAPFRTFRFPDPLIWVLIVGLVLVMLFGYEAGVGRMGVNLAVFMAGLFALRGVAVMLVLVGKVSWIGALLFGVGLALAAPVMFAGAMMVGVGDSWTDLRARAGRGEVSGSQ